MKYQSEIIHEILEQRGHEKSSLHYQSECIETWIEETKGAYPKLCDYESEWLNYIIENPIGEFPYVTLTDVTGATVDNVVPYAYKSAILSGSTKYRDIDTGEFLETFEEGRNLELVSVKMPVLTTSNEDDTKTNILTVNESVELRGIGDEQDTLDCLTGEVTQRIGEVVLDGSEEWTFNRATINHNLWLTTIANPALNTSVRKNNMLCDKLIVEDFTGFNDKDYEFVSISNGNSKLLYLKLDKTKGSTLTELKNYLQSNPLTVQYQLATESIKTVELTITDESGNKINHFIPIEGTMHIQTDGEPVKPSVTMEIPVEAITQNLSSFIEGE